MASPFPGYREAIPSYRSLLVFYDPEAIALADVRAHVRRALRSADASTLRTAPIKTVATVYDGVDLDDVAKRTGLSRDDVVRIHSETEYRVFMVGFTPGFAYMGLTDPKLDVERRATPRTRVPAGSVAIAMRQTAIYPSEAPGGWHLLGRADPSALFDVHRSPPSLFVPGDRVRFEPVDTLSEPERTSDRASAENTASSSSPVLEIEDGGLLTTVQDRGRYGFQRHGVPVAGAMDLPSLEEANRLVGNAADAAGLECTVAGPRIRCLATTVASITGADLGAVVERSDLGRWEPELGTSFRLRPGNVLSFEGGRSGARAYIGFAGGVDVPLVLGSRSTYLTAGFGGHQGRALRRGDRLCLLTPRSLAAGTRARTSSDDRGDVLRVVWGPQADYFTDGARATLESCVYVVGASSDRMGYRLEGEPLEHRDAKQIVSDGNARGSIQVPPDGLPIVLLADRATTGGYPKIATVLTVDTFRLAQRLPGETVRFRAVGNDERARRINSRKKK